MGARTRSTLVYGATGYTAELVIDAMVRAGQRPILSARNPVALRRLGERFDLPCRPASLDDRASLRVAFDGVQVVLNAAGPFVTTAEAVVTACIDAGAHYLDISGEVDAIQSVAALHARARTRGVMLMAGAGFDVVPSDCLCAHVARRVPDARKLRVAISGLELASPGSLKTLAYELGRQTRVWVGGALQEVAPGSLIRSFDFGAGLRPCTAVSWGDLITAPVTTGVGHVETYFELTPAVSAMVQSNRYFNWAYRLPWVRDGIDRQARRMITGGPTAEQRAARNAAVVVEVEDSAGKLSATRLITPESYTLTAQTASHIAARVALDDFEPGFQTPGRLFGADFILRFAGVTRVEQAEASIGR